MDTMNGIHNQFKLKDDMIANTEDYLSAQVSKMEANGGTGRQF